MLSDIKFSTSTSISKHDCCTTLIASLLAALMHTSTLLVNSFVQWLFRSLNGGMISDL